MKWLRISTRSPAHRLKPGPVSPLGGPAVRNSRYSRCRHTSWKYGTSVRVAAERDVLLEDVKDSAIAMYNRELAVRVVERRHALEDFTTLTAEEARALAERYDLNYLVTEATLALPEVYRNAQFRIYALKPVGPVS